MFGRTLACFISTRTCFAFVSSPLSTYSFISVVYVVVSGRTLACFIWTMTCFAFSSPTIHVQLHQRVVRRRVRLHAGLFHLDQDLFRAIGVVVNDICAKEYAEVVNICLRNKTKGFFNLMHRLSELDHHVENRSPPAGVKLLPVSSLIIIE